MVICNQFYPLSYLERYVSFNIKFCKYFVANLTNMTNFHPLEVVDRGIEIQLQIVYNTAPRCVYSVLSNFQICLTECSSYNS